ncbi:MAG: hypothetical protein AB4057_08525 [Crocosphaera sp.]
MDKPINKQVIDDIYRIGTPDAAIKLVSFLWDKDEDFAIYVAWHLGVLLKNPEVEEKLSKYQLKPEQTPVNELTYIWRPFENNSDSALFTITSRLAYLIKVSSTDNIPQPILPVDPRIIIPISAVEMINKVKKINLRKKINSLHNNIKFSSLDLDLQKILLNRLSPDMLINYRIPTRNDWIKLYAKDVNYNFQKSWNYYIILGLSIVISLIAVSEILNIMFRDPINIINLIVTPSLCLLIWYFWVVVSQGIEEILEPRFFIAFSLLGIITFLEELQYLLNDDYIQIKNHLLYSDIVTNPLYNYNIAVLQCYALSTLIKLGCLSMTIMLILTGTIVGVGIWKILVLGGTVLVMAGVIATIVSSAAKSTEKIEKPQDIVITELAVIIIFGGIIGGIVGIFLSLFIQTMFNLPEDIVLIKTVLGTWIAIAIGEILGSGLGAWYRAKDKRDWGRYLAIFAFPFFCTFPIIFGYSSYAFYDWFGLNWQQITIIWIGILGVCTVLWQWGQKLDYEARNPFKGILDTVNNDSDFF